MACEVSYTDAHIAMSYAGRKHRGLQYRYMDHIAAAYLGVRLINVTSQFKSKTLRTFQREVDQQNYLVITTGHMSGFRNGKIVDWAFGKCKRIKLIYKVEKGH